MCSTLETPPVMTVPALARLVEHARLAARAVSDAVAADPALLAEVPDELLEHFTLTALDTVDAATSFSTVLVGRVERRIGGVKGKLIAGRYPSTSRFLECEAGMAPSGAKVMVARGRDLDSHSTAVADAWLAGEIPGGAIAELTTGVTDLLRRSARTDTKLVRSEALETLLPIARRGRVDRLHRELADLRITHDPDGADERAMAAFEHQRLSIVQVGSMMQISGWLTCETGAATRTVLEHAASLIAVEQLGELTHENDCETVALATAGCTCGEVDRARRAAGLRHEQLLAHALGEVMTDRLDNAELGSHHRVAPHLTVVADLTDVVGAAHALVGHLAVPGSDDDIALPPATMHRLLCDSDITRVITTAAGGRAEDGRRLTDDARAVLYVGRTERVVTARQRRALETRDRICAFPGCRAHVRRCHAHHVVPWEHGGPSDLPNLALMCVAHHHAVHEGGWTMALKPGATGHEQGCWDFTAPPLRRRPLKP